MAEQKQQQEQRPSLLKTLIAGALGMEPAPPGSQPSLGAELAAIGRQGREDFLNAFMGTLAGSREPGSPGNPTPQLVTEALTGQDVNLQQDRIEPQKQKLGLDDLRIVAEQAAQRASQQMDHQNDRRHERQMGRSM